MLGVAGARVCFPGGITPCRHTCALTARPPACCSLLLPGRRVCVLERHPRRGPRLPGPRTARATTGFPCCRALPAAHGSSAPRSSSVTYSVGCAARPWSAGLLPRASPASCSHPGSARPALAAFFTSSRFLTALTTHVVLPCSFPATSARGRLREGGGCGVCHCRRPGVEHSAWHKGDAQETPCRLCGGNRSGMSPNGPGTLHQ